jgi:hypothetical protein
MIQQHFFGRSVLMAAMGLAMVLGAQPARADSFPTKAKTDAPMCVTAYKDAQEREHAGHLAAATQLFRSCAQATCGHAMFEDCASRYSQLRADTPSVVPMVTDDAGQARVDIEVRIDGTVLVSKLDGRAVSVDPGTHEFSFSTLHGVFATQRITIQHGEHNRLISVALHSRTSTK